MVTAFEYPILGVREVHDGDTYRLDIDVGFEHSAWPWLRLNGYYCPELDEKNGTEAKVYATSEMQEALIYGPGIWVRTFKRVGYEDMRKTFARYVADVYLGRFLDRSGDHLGDRLVAAGLASKQK